MQIAWRRQSPLMPERQKPIPQLVTELWDLIVLYFKQETLVPLQGLGKYIGLGVLGSVLMGFGVVFCTVSALRALQVATTAFEGDWTWVPYLIVVALLLIGAGITWMALRSAQAKTKAKALGRELP
jgi:Putative Actinobacterial Holin-X, holin superfamily III